MSAVTRIEDGFATTVGCHDGALIELQLVDEETPRKTWEILLGKGEGTTMDGLSPEDVMRVGQALGHLGHAAKEQAANHGRAGK